MYWKCLVVVVTLILVAGCEITDYEAVLAKKRLKDAAKQNAELQSQVESLKKDNQRLKSEISKSESSGESSESSDSDVDQLAIANAIESLGVYVGYNDDGDKILELDYTDAVYTNEDLKKIVDLPNLKTLIVNGSQADLGTFEIIGQIKSLQRLEIPISPATPEALSKLSGLAKLKYLQIFRSDVSDEAFKVLSKMPSLATDSVCPNANFR